MSKRLFSLGQLEGAPQSYLDAWKFTRSGILDDNATVLERDLRLQRAKQCIMRRLEKDDVAKEVERRLNKCAHARLLALANDAVESGVKNAVVHVTQKPAPQNDS